MSDTPHPQPSQPAGNPNRYKRHGSRFKARRRAVDILFEAEFRDVDPVEIVEERIKLASNPDNQIKPVADYTAQIAEGAANHLDAIDDAIATHLTSQWRLDRLPAVDRAVLRVSVWELLFNPDVPPRVALVEGVELASQYSHVQAPNYVHAVLDGISRDAQRIRAEAAAAAPTDPAAAAETLAPEPAAEDTATPSATPDAPEET